MTALIFLSFLATNSVELEPEWQRQLTGQQEFDFYFGEILNQRLDDDDPMKPLIQEGLAQSVFSTTNEEQFLDFLDALQWAFENYPEKHRDFIKIDRLLSEEFQKKVKKAKRYRLYSTIGGAGIGGLIGLPIGRAFSSSKVLWISIPAGMALGGGAGFLLGDLLWVPSYEYEKGSVSRDLEKIHRDLESLRHE